MVKQYQSNINNLRSKEVWETRREFQIWVSISDGTAEWDLQCIQTGGKGRL